MKGTIEIKDLHVQVEGKEILKGVNLTIHPGEVHAMMGPNGSGKSTLAYTIMGHPKYEVTGGDILFEGESILDLSPDERARKGIFLAMQYPVAVSGVTLANFLRASVSAVRGYGNGKGDGKTGAVGSHLMPMREFRRELKENMARLKMDISFASRYLNDGFSGGEKKRAEILQMAMLKPKVAILDETDSGLDIDALRIVADGVNSLIGPDLGVLVITHYQRLLNYIKPHFVHIFYKGRIVQSDGPELALMLEEKGYEWITEEFGG
jgi:Fe-S cluster assembly ATP-binding protein